jgi:hypothetical protein
MRAILVCLVSAILLTQGVQLSAAQTTGHSPRGYPYNSKTCAGGFRACVNHYLKVGWQSPAASSYCSHACTAAQKR